MIVSEHWEREGEREVSEEKGFSQPKEIITINTSELKDLSQQKVRPFTLKGQFSFSWSQTE